jgi:translation initiation factor IF-3
MAHEFTGQIKRIGKTQIVSDKFSKREFTVVDKPESEYPQIVQFELHKDKCDTINSFKEGDNVRVSFNLKGREWTNKEGEVKTFNTLQCWAIVKLSAGEKKSDF